jgi:hypothetical protein
MVLDFEQFNDDVSINSMIINRPFQDDNFIMKRKRTKYLIKSIYYFKMNESINMIIVVMNLIDYWQV